MRVSFYFFLFLTAYGAMEANPVARGYGLSARTACSVGAFWLCWGCRVCMYVCVFLLSQGLGPPCQFLVSGVSRPWEGAYPPRHKSARQAFRWESRSARHFPRQPSRATCVPDTECGWTSTDAASKRMR